MLVAVVAAATVSVSVAVIVVGRFCGLVRVVGRRGVVGWYCI